MDVNPQLYSQESVVAFLLHSNQRGVDDLEEKKNQPKKAI